MNFEFELKKTNENKKHYFWSVLFSLLIYSGYIKGFPFFEGSSISVNIPIFIILCIPIIKAIVTIDLIIPKISLLLFCYIILCALPLLWSPDTAFSIEKITIYFTVTAFILVTSPLLVKTNDQLKAFLLTIFIISLVILLYSVLSFPSLNLDSRSSLWMNPIWFSRILSVPVIFSSSILFFSDVKIHHKLIAILLAFTASYFMILSGSKGPLVSVILSVAITYILFYRNTLKKYLNMYTFFAFSTAFVILIMYNLPSKLLKRFSNFFTLNFSEGSELVRISNYKIALSNIASNPFGVGYGGFAELGLNKWPHNLLLEVFVELGWVIGVFFLIIIVTALRSLFYLATKNNFYYKVMFMLFVTDLINSMFSGHINSPKLMYALIGISIYHGGKRKICKENYILN